MTTKTRDERLTEALFGLLAAVVICLSAGALIGCTLVGVLHLAGRL